MAIAGEPGIGKTRLLAELAARADADRRLVLEGGAAEIDQGSPFAAIVDALDDYLASLNPRLLAPLAAEERAELARIFPALAGEAEDERGPEGERFRAHRAVRSLLDLLAVGQPVVLAVDDLHWADEASAELLAYLVRRPPKGPVVLALAHRPQLPDPLRAALAQAEREDRVASPHPHADDHTRDARLRRGVPKPGGRGGLPEK